MLSKNKIKFIQSLSLKKNRIKNKMFVAEGIKIVNDLLDSDFTIKEIYFTEENTQPYISQLNNAFLIQESAYKKISLLKTPPGVLALVEMPEFSFDFKELNNDLTIVLDEIQDPGNLGTIVRIANWFGIKNIICSEHSVDIYNPKAVQATMGSITGVKVHYKNLVTFLSEAKNYDIPVFGTFMEGETIYSSALSRTGIIVFGNESNGISTEIARLIDKKIFIPSYNHDQTKTESLNVAIAASITCAEFRRKQQL